MKQKVYVIGGGRREIKIKLGKAGEDIEVLILFVVRVHEKLELVTWTEHKARITRANVWVRGVVMDQAEAEIRGLIQIHKGADKTESFLRQNVLILSQKARADVRPILEIEADDVKASHAATVGRVDAEQLFYLMSRGLTEEEARELIIKGFLQGVLTKIKDKKAEAAAHKEVEKLFEVAV